jgi:hypothetical protein
MTLSNTAIAVWRGLRRSLMAALFPRYWMAVIAQEPLRLVLNSDGREVTADGTARTIRTADKLLASFDAVLSIDVVRHPRSPAEHKPEHWSLTLYLGRSQRAFVGRSRKLPQVEKAAKLLATITGKPVRTLEVLGPNSHIPTR